MAQENEFESFALQKLDYAEFKMHQCTVLLKDKTVINNVLTASNVVEIIR